MNRLLASALLSTGLALTAAPVLAQDAAAPTGKGPQASQRQGGERAAQRHGGDRTERVEARIAQLKTTLKITDAQLPQWNAFADTLRKQAQAGGERMKARQASAKGAKPATAIEQLEQRKAFLAAASARMDELLAAAKPLYAAFSPEQQKIADGLLARHGERGRGGPRQRGGPAQS